MDVMEFLTSIHFVGREAAWKEEDKLEMARSQGASGHASRVPVEVLQTVTHNRALEGYFLGQLLADASFCRSEESDYGFSIVSAFAFHQLVSRGTADRMLVNSEAAHIVCHSINDTIKRLVKIVPNVPLVINPLGLENATSGDSQYKSVVEILTLISQIDVDDNKAIVYRPIHGCFREKSVRFTLSSHNSQSCKAISFPVGLLILFRISSAARCAELVKDYLSLLSECCNLIIYDTKDVVLDCLMAVERMRSWRSITIKTITYGSFSPNKELCLAILQGNSLGCSSPV